MIKNLKLILIFGVVAILIFGVYFIRGVWSPIDRGAGDAVFTIEAGQSLKTISKNLKDAGLIRSRLVFESYAKLKNQESGLLAGNHLLSKKMNTAQILNVLITGGSFDNEALITIIEGWRIEEIGAYLEKQGLVSQKEFFANVATSQWQAEFDFLAGVKATRVEGFLFPDTYRVFKDATAEDIVRKMLTNFGNKVKPEVRAEIAKQGKSLFEVVTLASIIEREVPKDEDKKMIADIFLKRLKDGIALQSDATVNYVTNKGMAQPTYEDLKIDSPYNTYKYRGLPPGPISNPGVASIEAVVYPTKNQYYYFLTTLDDSRVIYGRTYEDHLANKAKYLD